MLNLILFFLISLINVFLHIFRSILVIKQSKEVASIANGITYTFSAVVIKFISESSYIVALVVAFITNTLGCYLAMWFYEKYFNKNENN